MLSNHQDSGQSVLNIRTGNQDWNRVSFELRKAQGQLRASSSRLPLSPAISHGVATSQAASTAPRTQSHGIEGQEGANHPAA